MYIQYACLCRMFPLKSHYKKLTGSVSCQYISRQNCAQIFVWFSWCYLFIIKKNVTISQTSDVAKRNIGRRSNENLRRLMNLPERNEIVLLNSLT